MNWDYIHGLFMADGSLYKEKRNGKEVETKKRLKITLNKEIVINKIKTFLEKNGLSPVLFKEGYKIKDGSRRYVWTVRLNRQCDIKYFISKEPESINLDVIAGFVDGDGCFRFYNYHGGRSRLKEFLIHVSKERKIKFIQKMRKFLKENFNIIGKEYIYDTYTYRITSQEDYEKFKKLIGEKLYVKEPV